MNFMIEVWTVRRRMARRGEAARKGHAALFGQRKKKTAPRLPPRRARRAAAPPFCSYHNMKFASTLIAAAAAVSAVAAAPLQPVSQIPLGTHNKALQVTEKAHLIGKPAVDDVGITLCPGTLVHATRSRNPRGALAARIGPRRRRASRAKLDKHRALTFRHRAAVRASLSTLPPPLSCPACPSALLLRLAAVLLCPQSASSSSARPTTICSTSSSTVRCRRALTSASSSPATFCRRSARLSATTPASRSSSRSSPSPTARTRSTSAPSSTPARSASARPPSSPSTSRPLRARRARPSPSRPRTT